MKNEEPTSTQNVRNSPRERAAVHSAKPQAIQLHAIWTRLEPRTLRYSLRTSPKMQRCSASMAIATAMAAFLGFILQKPGRGSLSVAVLLSPSSQFSYSTELVKPAPDVQL